MNSFSKFNLSFRVLIQKNYRLGILLAGVVWLIGVGMYLNSQPVYLATSLVEGHDHQSHEFWKGEHDDLVAKRLEEIISLLKREELERHTAQILGLPMEGNEIPIMEVEGWRKESYQGTGLEFQLEWKVKSTNQDIAKKWCQVLIEEGLPTAIKAKQTSVLEKLRKQLEEMTKEEKAREEKLKDLTIKLEGLMNSQQASSSEASAIQQEIQSTQIAIEALQDEEREDSNGLNGAYVNWGIDFTTDFDSIPALRSTEITEVIEISLWGLRKYWWVYVFLAGLLFSGLVIVLTQFSLLKQFSPRATNRNI